MGTVCEGLAGDSELRLGFEEEEEERDRWGNEGLERQWRRAWERRSLRAAIIESVSERKLGFWRWGLVTEHMGFGFFQVQTMDYRNAFLFFREILQFSIFTHGRGVCVFLFSFLTFLPLGNNFIKKNYIENSNNLDM